MSLRGWINDLRTITRIYQDVKSIARRMFITNSIDSIIAALGVGVGGYTPEVNAKLLAMSIIGGGVAMGFISATLGVYLSERAERLREFKDLEKKLAASLKESVHWKAARLVPIYVALWSGFGAIIFPLLIALPFAMAGLGIISNPTAYHGSLSVGLLSMGFLGLYLSRVSGENPLHSLARTLAMGVLAIVLVSVLRFIVV